MRRMILGLVFIGLLSSPVSASFPPPACAPIPAFADNQDFHYFAPTRHSIGNGFLHYWQANGGLAQFGYPLTEEFDQGGGYGEETRTVQYFERARFEYHPEFRDTSYVISLGRLGVEAVYGPPNIFTPEPDNSAPSGSLLVLYFPQTRHNVYTQFAYFWQDHGGVPILGYPISAEYRADARDLAPGLYRDAQWFERGRIEVVHTRTSSPNAPVLGLVGDEVSPCRGL